MFKSITQTITRAIKWYLHNKLYLYTLLILATFSLYEADIISFDTRSIINIISLVLLIFQLLHIRRYNNMYPRYLNFLLMMTPISGIFQIWMYRHGVFVEDKLNLFLKKSQTSLVIIYYKMYKRKKFETQLELRIFLRDLS